MTTTYSVAEVSDPKQQQLQLNYCFLVVHMVKYMCQDVLCGTHLIFSLYNVQFQCPHETRSLTHCCA